MYRKGDLQVTHDSYVSDARDDNYEGVPSGTAYLEHSCGEWVIGSVENAQALIEDLQAYVDAMKNAV